MTEIKKMCERCHTTNLLIYFDVVVLVPLTAAFSRNNRWPLNQNAFPFTPVTSNQKYLEKQRTFLVA